MMLEGIARLIFLFGALLDDIVEIVGIGPVLKVLADHQFDTNPLGQRRRFRQRQSPGEPAQALQFVVRVFDAFFVNRKRYRVSMLYSPDR